MSIEKLDFQKVTKENLPYTLVLTKVIQNIKHIEALAVWVYLCSLPPDWKINKEHLKAHFGLGDRKLREIFSYLKRCFLIEYHQERFESGILGDHVIHVLCGDKFNPNEPYKKTGRANITSPDKNSGRANSDCADISPVGQKTARAVNRTGGFGALQKKQNTNALKRTKKTKSFLSKKSVDNSARHSFAESKDMMASEQRNIEDHEKRKALELEMKRTNGLNPIQELLLNRKSH